MECVCGTPNKPSQARTRLKHHNRSHAQRCLHAIQGPMSRILGKSRWRLHSRETTSGDPPRRKCAARSHVTVLVRRKHKRCVVFAEWQKNFPQRACGPVVRRFNRAKTSESGAGDSRPRATCALQRRRFQPLEDRLRARMRRASRSDEPGIRVRVSRAADG